MKKSLHLSQMVNLNAGIFGIQFAWMLEVANMTGIFSFFHAKPSSMGLFWLSLPVTGLFLQGLVGFFSDRTYTVLGQRLPYIIIGSILTAISLIWLPNSLSLMMVISLLWFFTAAVNIALQPYRALVVDHVVYEQHTKIYAIQACLVGVGATVASIMPWVFSTIFHITAMSKNGIPLDIKFAFYMGSIVLILTGLVTAVSSQRYFKLKEENTTRAGESLKPISLKDNLISLIRSHSAVKDISFTQFLTWMGVFCFIVYLTLHIAQNVYGIPYDQHLLSEDKYAALMERSTVLTGICCAIYMAVSAIFSFIIPYLTYFVSRKIILIIALAIGGFSLIIAGFSHSAILICTLMVGFGVAWASFNSIPYAIISNHAPKESMGFFMGMFNVFVCLPQIIVGVFIGKILETAFHHHAADIIILGGIFFLLAAVYAIKLKDTPRVMLS